LYIDPTGWSSSSFNSSLLASRASNRRSNSFQNVQASFFLQPGTILNLIVERIWNLLVIITIGPVVLQPPLIPPWTWELLPATNFVPFWSINNRRIMECFVPLIKLQLTGGRRNKSEGSTNSQHSKFHFGLNFITKLLINIYLIYGKVIIVLWSDL